MIQLFLILLFPFSSQLCGYEYNHYVSEEVWQRLSPYFLPEEHPIKSTLDSLFTSSRVTLNMHTLKRVGFFATPQKVTRLLVTRHADCPGIIFKLYVDAQQYYKDIPEYEHWILRIEGAHAIREALARHGWEGTFKTPKKWIYPLPEEPSPPRDYLRKNFILIEEDMDLIGTQDNLAAWADPELPYFLLDQLYTLLEEIGLHDCAKPTNVPFSKDGRIAFIDTESHHEWPVATKSLLPFLDPSRRLYWKRLRKFNRPLSKLQSRASACARPFPINF